MKTFAKIGIAVLLTVLVALSGCQKTSTQSTPPECLTAIGINGHLDKATGQWIPAWGYIDALGDTQCCFWTEIEATTVAALRDPILEVPEWPRTWNYLLTVTPDTLSSAGYEMTSEIMPSPSPVPFIGGFWLSVYQDSTGYVWIGVSPLPQNMGPAL